MFTRPVTTFTGSQGRDVFWPIYDSNKEWQGTLVLKTFGFDLDGVPDGEDDVYAALRSSLGHLKRDAERAFLAKSSPPIIAPFQVPEFEFVGKTKR